MMNSTEYDDIRARWLSKRQRATAAAAAANTSLVSTTLNNLSTSKLSVNLNHTAAGSSGAQEKAGATKANRSRSSSPVAQLDKDQIAGSVTSGGGGTRPRRVFRLRHQLTAADDDNENENKIEFFDDEKNSRTDSYIINQQHSDKNQIIDSSAVLPNTPPSTQSSASNKSYSGDDEQNDNMNIDYQHRQQLHAKAVKSRRGTYSIVFTPAAPIPLQSTYNNSADVEDELLPAPCRTTKTQHAEGTSRSATIENSSSNSATSRDDDEASDNNPDDDDDEAPAPVRMRCYNTNGHHHHRHSTANIYLEHLNEVNNKQPRVAADRAQLSRSTAASGYAAPHTMQRHLTCSSFKNVLAKFQTVDQQQHHHQPLSASDSVQSRNSSRSSATTNNGHHRNNNYNRYHYSSTLSIPTALREQQETSKNKWKQRKSPTNNRKMGNTPVQQQQSYATTAPPMSLYQQQQSTLTSAANYSRTRSSQNADDSLYASHTAVGKTLSSSAYSSPRDDHQPTQPPKQQQSPPTTTTTDGVRLRAKPQQQQQQNGSHHQAPPPHWRHSTSTLSLAISKFEKLNAASANGEQLAASKPRPTVFNRTNALENTHGYRRVDNDKHRAQELSGQDGESSPYNDENNDIRRRSSIPAGVVLEKTSRFETLSEQHEQQQQRPESDKNNAGATTPDTQTPTPPPPPTRRRSSANIVPSNGDEHSHTNETNNNVTDQQHNGGNAVYEVNADQQKTKKRTAPVKTTTTNLVKDRLKQFENKAGRQLVHEPSLYQQTLKKNNYLSKSNADLVSPYGRQRAANGQQQMRPAVSTLQLSNFHSKPSEQNSARDISPAADSAASKEQQPVVTRTNNTSGDSGRGDASKPTSSTRLRSTTPTDSRLSAPLSRATSSSFGDEHDGDDDTGATPPPSDELGTANGGGGGGGRQSVTRTHTRKPSDSQAAAPEANSAAVPAFIVATRRGTFGAPAKFVAAQRKSIQQEVILPKCKSFSPEQLEEMVDLARELTAIAPVEERDRFIYVTRIERPVGQTNGGGVGLVLSTENNKVHVSKVISHSLAHRQTTIESGDRLLVVNGTLIDIDMHHREALQILKAPRAEVLMVLQRGKDEHLPASTAAEEQEQIKVEPPPPPPPMPVLAFGSLTRVKSVHLVAEEEGFGISVDGGRSPSNLGDSKPIVIRRIYANSPAERSSRMHVGDELVEIDGQQCATMTKFHAWDLLKSFQTGQQVGMKIRSQQKPHQQASSRAERSEVEA